MRARDRGTPAGDLRSSAEVGRLEPGGPLQLIDRALVEGAVLADVERRQVKPERLGRANHGRDGGIRHAPRADGDERVVQQPKIRDELGRALVPPGPESQAPALGVDALERQLRQHQADKPTPGLAVFAIVSPALAGGVRASTRALTRALNAGGGGSRRSDRLACRPRATS